MKESVITPVPSVLSRIPQAGLDSADRSGHRMLRQALSPGPGRLVRGCVGHELRALVLPGGDRVVPDEIGLYSLSGLGAWELTRDMDQNWHGFAMGLVLIGLFHGTISVFTLWMAIIDLGKCQELLATAQARRRTGEPN